MSARHRAEGEHQSTATGRARSRWRSGLGYTPDQVRRVYDDIDQKRRATTHLHAPPILLEPVDELPRIAPASPRPGI